MNKNNFSLIQTIVVIFIMFTLIAILGPIVQRFTTNCGGRAQNFNNLKNLVLSMQDYASSDTKFSRMPYPVAFNPSNNLPKWGETKECWSPEIVKLLFKNHTLAKGNENILVSTGVTGDIYDPMLLSEDMDAKGDVNKMRWESDAELHFHVFCYPKLTNAASGNMVMGISYDQPDINNCLFKGEGWIVFFMDGSGGWKKRKLFGHYDFDYSADKLVRTISAGAGLKAVKKLDPKASLREVFGVNGNGGSTELIGSKSTSAFYISFVEE